ncbi:ABC transporter substrate-binding protein [Glycomyces algeriensis]|uniref:ABC transporter substrate-binding protein n=1 Tax=Glycomyces algeriensis TaxID=256037 RepID=A0A9W6G9N1_9ACTN|nr:ABC transporter substrate-binding protein [Glycomyces algeriensis]MDA1365495.1 ABC transporter substrate-binding protein [Glycomyces algeriensis]MDR7351181.1 peptide/nickel transport system substrate-binding protein [Glycomyces algeriensis]GLI43894.1 ABC transporter substrate-binding protein [Glycomyces algeriensis]
MIRKATRAAAALAAAALLLTACSGGGQEAAGGDGSGGTPQTGGTVHMLQNADFSYLDPARGWDGGVNAFYRLIYRGLTMQAAGDAEDPNAVVPDMAEGLGTPSPDGLTWTYTLKEGLKFDNGDPITSTELEFGISRAWDPEIGIGSPWLKNTVEAPADYKGPYQTGDHPGIETPDAQTIVFHLKAPFPEFDNVVSQVNAVPFPVGTGAGDEFIKDVIASGPYTLDSYTPGSSIKLVRNEHWDAATDEVRKAYPDAWEFEIGLEGATIDERLLAGQGTDVNAIAGKIQPATLARIQSPELQERAISAEAYCVTYMGMDTTQAPFDKVEVRQAMNYAVDRTSLQTASGGNQLALPATTIIPNAVNGHKDFDLYPSEGDSGDPAKAQELLESVGLGDGFSFTLDIRSNPIMQAQAESIQQALAKINVDVQLNVIDTSTFYETIGTPSQMHDAAITGWCPDWASSSSTMVPPLVDGRVITEKGNTNIAQINDPGINARIDEIRAMTDLDAANVEWGEFDEEVMALAPLVPLLQEPSVFLPGENIAGYIPNTSMTDLTIIGLSDPSAG